MKEKIRKYTKILRIELEDLQEDLLMMAEIYHQRELKREITDYVFLENLSLLQSEIAGIDNIINSLQDINPDEFSSIEEFAGFISEQFKKKTLDAGFPESVFALVNRKLVKVSRYILSEED
ncbi:MAG: hypothetical protein JW852_05920 [Spirochaetales bacterium]|nr:hypothetical protein [Spirochaetales bacterium]